MENMENQNAQEPVMEPAAQEPTNEPANGNQEVEITTKEALAALRKNAKAQAKKVWEKTKPKLKVIATVGAIGLTGAYIYSELTKPELSSSDTKMLEPTPLDIPPSEYQVMDQVMGPELQEPVMEPAAQEPVNVVNPEG